MAVKITSPNLCSFAVGFGAFGPLPVERLSGFRWVKSPGPTLSTSWRQSGLTACFSRPQTRVLCQCGVPDFRLSPGERSCEFKGSKWSKHECWNLIKKPWAFLRVLNMNPNILGQKGQGVLIRFLHYLPQSTYILCALHLFGTLTPRLQRHGNCCR